MLSPDDPTEEFAAVAKDLQLSAASLADRIVALPHRLTVSHDSLTDAAPLLTAALGATRQEVQRSSRQLLHESVKVRGNAIEELRVRAAQLSAHAMLLEREAEDGEDTRTLVVARALLSCPGWGATNFVHVTFSGIAALLAVDEVVRLRDGVDPSQCIVSGDGIMFRQEGDNSVTLTSVDALGDAVGSIEASDVCVSVVGARVTGVSVQQAGGVEVVYRVPATSVAAVTLGLSVCAAALPGSPWTIPCLLGDSAILASVAPERAAAFLRELSAWLPRRGYTLLYRGSRDGMNAATFHGLCDGKGPTLVLVRCDKGWVFGGYAGASWISSRMGE
ncbi:MAG: TLD domain-containing protein, partial [Terracidiphilus sp.]|nr:TLD domain-containing protein [Terracidiphilus sp.]